MTYRNLIQFANNAKGTLSTSLGPSDSSLNLTGGQGALFPRIDSSLDEVFYVTITSQSNPAITEIVQVNYGPNFGSPDTLSGLRDADGTSRNGNSYSPGATVELRITAESIEQLFGAGVFPAELAAGPYFFVKYNRYLTSGFYSGTSSSSSSTNRPDQIITTDGETVSTVYLTPDFPSDIDNVAPTVGQQNNTYFAIPFRGHPWQPGVNLGGYTNGKPYGAGGAGYNVGVAARQTQLIHFNTNYDLSSSSGSGPYTEITDLNENQAGFSFSQSVGKTRIYPYIEWPLDVNKLPSTSTNVNVVQGAPNIYPAGCLAYLGNVAPALGDLTLRRNNGNPTLKNVSRDSSLVNYNGVNAFSGSNARSEGELANNGEVWALKVTTGVTNGDSITVSRLNYIKKYDPNTRPSQQLSGIPFTTYNQGWNFGIARNPGGSPENWPQEGSLDSTLKVHPPNFLSMRVHCFGCHSSRGVTIPYGTYVKKVVTSNVNTSSQTDVLTFNNNVTIPTNAWISLVFDRYRHLSRMFSAAYRSTVYYKRDNENAQVLPNGLNGVYTQLGTQVGTTNTLNADQANVPEGSYLPLAPQIANVYITSQGNNGNGTGNGGNPNTTTSNTYTISMDTDAHNNGTGSNGNMKSMSQTIKPLSTFSVFAIRVLGNMRTTNGYSGFLIICDYLDSDPQPNNNRIFKDTNATNTPAKACFGVETYSANDRYKIVEYVNTAGFHDEDMVRPSTLTHHASATLPSDGRIVSGKWPNDSTTINHHYHIDRERNSTDAHNNTQGYNSGNIHGLNVDSVLSRATAVAAAYHVTADVNQGAGSISFFRPETTDRIRFRLVAVNVTNNSQTQYLPHGGNLQMHIEEHVQPENKFALDVEGGLDTTNGWNGDRFQPPEYFNSKTLQTVNRDFGAGDWAYLNGGYPRGY